MNQPKYDGLLLIDKPQGITSRQVVDQALGWFPRKTRLGHCGTLDPLATGVLVLCVGVATRLTEYVQEMEKVYRAEITLGSTSTTDDADGTIEELPGVSEPGIEAIDTTLQSFVGEIEQVPPAFSASKLEGKRAYDLARKGKTVTLEPRLVRIHQIDLLAYAFPILTIEVRCGKGTYIRSLARDLGARLGVGGYISALRRLRIGPFRVEDALSAESRAEEARARLLPLSAAVAHLPGVSLAHDIVSRLRHGQAVPASGLALPACREIAVYSESGQLVAIAELDEEQKCLAPVKVLPAS